MAFRRRRRFGARRSGLAVARRWVGHASSETLSGTTVASIHTLVAPEDYKQGTGPLEASAVTLARIRGELTVGGVYTGAGTVRVILRWAIQKLDFDSGVVLDPRLSAGLADADLLAQGHFHFTLSENMNVTEHYTHVHREFDVKVKRKLTLDDVILIAAFEDPINLPAGLSLFPTVSARSLILGG